MADALRILGAPGRYLQGQHAIKHIGEVVKDFGQTCFVVADAFISGLMKEEVTSYLCASRLDVVFGLFSGECTREEINHQVALAKESNCDVIIGMGGGKTIDTAKGVSLELNLPIIIVPTIASNDSSTSRLIVIYDDQHHIEAVLKLPTNPDVILVDTAIIANAPPRFLIAGIGDALSKKFEAEQCALTGARNFFGGLPTRTAQEICNFCYSTIREFGIAAVNAVKQNQTNDSLENVVEATVLLSGIGFESGGLAVAHGLTRGLTAQVKTQGALHGEMVAWGLLVQLIAEGREVIFIDELMTFYKQIGLPTTLTDLGFQCPSRQAMKEIAETTCLEAPYIKNMVKPLSPERLANCIQALEK